MEHPLRKFRDAHDLTLDDFAARIGISAASLSRIERRLQNPPLDRLRQIVQQTGGKVTADDLLPPISQAAE